MPGTIRVPEPRDRKRRVAVIMAALLLVCGWLPLSVPGADWRIPVDDRDGRELSFQLSWEGEPLNGRFRRFDGAIRFDPKRPADARFEVRVALASVDLGNPELEQVLSEPSWFDSKRFPEAVFRGLAATPVEDGRYRMSGELDLKGQRRPVDLLFVWRQSDGRARLRGEARLDRREFAVGDGEWRDDETVAFSIRVVFDLGLIPGGVDDGAL